MKSKIVFYFLIICCQSIIGQSRINRFLQVADTLNLSRQKSVFVAQAVLSAGTIIALNQLWYADYPKSKFHFINDNNNWLQVDKLGHFYSSYQLGRFGAETLKWSGVNKKSQLVYGASLGFVFLAAVEVLDGFSAEWGTSMGDVIANTTGTALYVSQELVWHEQRIVPKFSFHTTNYANLNPNVLGKSFQEQILKDYNGQTYWLSVNLHSFAKGSKIPKWLNIALGYGADGMLHGNLAKNGIEAQLKERKSRQFYLSFDVDLTKINTKSHVLKTLFSVFNTVKIPAPTLQYTTNSGLKVYAIYF